MTNECFNLNDKQKIYKNFFALNVSFFLLFACLNSIAGLQSVLHQDKNLGVTSLIVVYVVQLISSLVIPQVISDLIGYKWSIIASQIGYTIYLACNMSPSKYALLSGFKIFFFEFFK